MNEEIGNKCGEIAEKMGDAFQNGLKEFDRIIFDEEALKIIITIIASLQTGILECFSRLLPPEERMKFCKETIETISGRCIFALDKFYKGDLH